MRLMRLVQLLIPPLLLAACSDVVFIESTNQNSRIDYVVIHATSENFAESVRLLTRRNDTPPVSSHYLIPAENDPSYNRRRLLLHQFVEEEQRAWHAGISYWAGERTLNDRSIGIEIVNEFDCETTPETDIDSLQCEFLPFDEAQIEMTIELLRGIQQRYPDIDPLDYLAHSDIATERRSDPGPLFPWKRLYDEGIGAWYDEETKARYESEFESQPPDVERLQAALLRLGYFVEPTGEFDKLTRFAVRAMQLRFRPDDISGEPDVETMAILWSLIGKYRRGDPP
ncbi:MAG: N-acetylmuramoyl-L-alanine amidase [Gammaproteobacteria bacterium]|nr:N-acetylmuramoyl-L-alanine amidase [Gammaproteobacteria bacterium]MYE30664.1 N-acetylmuramoyl-L-alanine amidase [Gammaproteobacteria bacterium]